MQKKRHQHCILQYYERVMVLPVGPGIQMAFGTRAVHLVVALGTKRFLVNAAYNVILPVLFTLGAVVVVMVQ